MNVRTKGATNLYDVAIAERKEKSEVICVNKIASIISMGLYCVSGVMFSCIFDNMISKELKKAKTAQYTKSVGGK